MSDYARPPLPRPLFRDGDGAVIDYGDRWGQEMPPSESYSRVTHSERFAPLHAVADALIEHLVSTYDVDVSDNPAHAADLMHQQDDVVRAVRLVPSIRHAAPLTFSFTAFPGVIVHAGLLHDFPFPRCGCDACDETLDSLAEELEWQVLAVAAGNYREGVGGAAGDSMNYSLSAVDGSGRTSGEGRSNHVPQDRLRAAKKQLAALPGGWAAWPARTRSGH